MRKNLASLIFVIIVLVLFGSSGTSCMGNNQERSDEGGSAILRADMPTELLHHISRYFSIEDCASVVQTCRDMRERFVDTSGIETLNSCRDVVQDLKRTVESTDSKCTDGRFLPCLKSLYSAASVRKGKKELPPVMVFRSFNLDSCKIGQPDLSVLSALRNLRKLDLSNNKAIVAVPNELSFVPFLEEFRLAYSDARPEGLAPLQGLRFLKILDLSGNKKLTGLPGEISFLQKLESIDINSCDLRAEGILALCKLLSLKELDASWNENLVAIPSELFELPLLEELDLRGCNLTEAELDSLSVRSDSVILK